MDTVRERPVSFGSEMVRAIQAGRKTQTRKIINGAPFWTTLQLEPVDDSLPRFVDNDGSWVQELNKDYGWSNGACVITDNGKVVACPFGKVGDRLWVQETWQAGTPALPSGAGIHPLHNAYTPMRDMKIIYRADGDDYTPKMYWRSPLSMSRWASRITLEIADIRVQRLQDISAEDALAEGVKS